MNIVPPKLFARAAPYGMLERVSTVSIARAVITAVTFLASALPGGLPATAQVLQGEPGAPTTREFPDSRVLPIPTPPFPGDIQPNLIDSKPAWPPTISPPEGAPNVLLILIDDAGFGSNTAFGGVVPTPTLDELAKVGLRYTQMHNTALCSPTRAALLTGRNHHAVGYGMSPKVRLAIPATTRSQGLNPRT